jgi:hypothetical protein
MDVAVHDSACPQRSIGSLKLSIGGVGASACATGLPVRRARSRPRQSEAPRATRGAIRAAPLPAVRGCPEHRPRTTSAAGLPDAARDHPGALALLGARAAHQRSRALPAIPASGPGRSPLPVLAPSARDPHHAQRDRPPVGERRPQPPPTRSGCRGRQRRPPVAPFQIGKQTTRLSRRACGESIRRIARVRSRGVREGKRALASDFPGSRSLGRGYSMLSNSAVLAASLSTACRRSSAPQRRGFSPRETWRARRRG